MHKEKYFLFWQINIARRRREKCVKIWRVDKMYEKINNLMISKTISIKYKDFLCCEKKNFKSKFYIANISKVCNQIKSKIKSH